MEGPAQEYVKPRPMGRVIAVRSGAIPNFSKFSVAPNRYAIYYLTNNPKAVFKVNGIYDPRRISSSFSKVSGGLWRPLQQGVGLRRDSQGSPSAALAFSEALLLCPTRNRPPRKYYGSSRSTAFLDISAFQEKHIAGIRTSGALENTAGTTPFYVVAAACRNNLLFFKKALQASGSKVL